MNINSTHFSVVNTLPINYYCIHDGFRKKSRNLFSLSDPVRANGDQSPLIGPVYRNFHLFREKQFDALSFDYVMLVMPHASHRRPDPHHNEFN